MRSRFAFALVDSKESPSARRVMAAFYQPVPTGAVSEGQGNVETENAPRTSPNPQR
jgi:hypothetical protein